MVRADGSSEWMKSKCDRIKVEPGDTLYFNTWGGGGWGDPLQREAAKVALDARRGIVSTGGARRYGVVLRDDFSLDEAATTSLRQTMATTRGAVALFDFGGTVEELKARCKEDTQLEPPKAPVFQKWMGRVKAEAAE
jgi:N-methylhydantoinase B